MKKASFNFIASVLYQIANLMVGLFLPKFYTEIFGSVYNGLNSSVSQIMSLLAVLQFGISAPSIQQMFKYIATDNKEMISAIYWDTGKQYRRMGYIFLLAIIPIIILFPLMIKDDLPYMIIVSFILLRAISSAMEYFFQAKYSVIMIAHNFSYVIYIINIIMLLFSTILHFMVLFFTKNILLYQSVAVLATFVRLIIVHTYINKNFHYLKGLKKQSVKLEKNTKRNDVLVSEIAGMVINSTDLIVLSSMSGLISASIYSVYSYVTSGLGNVLSSCREAVFAGVGKAYYADFATYQKKMEKFESIYLFLVFFLYSTAILLFRPFIETYTARMDAKYYYLGLPLLFILEKFIVNIRIPSIVAINTAGHFKQVKNYAVIEAIINIIVSISLVKPLGVYGVLIGTIAGAIYRTPILIHYTSKNILQRTSFYYWKKILLWIPMFIICCLLSTFLPIKCSSLGEWIIKAFPTAIAVFTGSLLWMFLFDKSTLKSLTIKLKSKILRKGIEK